MPGIIGLITRRHASDASAQLAAMFRTMHQEDFYSSGTLTDESLGVYVGWTALTGSFSDGNPLANETNDVSLIFSGDEFPDAHVVQELRRRSHDVGQGRSAYLIHLYEEDPDFVRNLNGMFHGLIIDRKRNVLTLFNDRYGMHRLYYHESADGFYFASEAKAILAVRPELRSCDLRGLGEFVALSCVLGDRTIFRDVHVLPAASAWTFRNACLEHKGTYFTPRQWENQSSLEPEPYYHELRSSLTTTLPRYFAGPEQAGIAMTGGLDTRVILASHPPAPGSLPGYTFGSIYRDTYDVRIGRQVAAISKQSHQIIEIGDEFLRNFGTFAERSILISEGTVDLYRASDLYLSSKVREIAPAKIVGTYGSEIVRRAVMFKPVEPEPGLFVSDFLPHVQSAASTYGALRREHPVTFAAFRQSPWYHSGILALEKSQLTVRSPFMDNEFVRAVYRAPQSYQDEDIRLRLIKDGSLALAHLRSDRGVGGNGSRAGSFLARASREFTFKAEYAYDYGMPQPLARVDHLLSGLHLERLFFGRHKALHFRVWYRDQLSDYVRQMLLDSRSLSRPYIEADAVRKIVDDHTRRGMNYTATIHKLLTLELLHQLFLT
jgi:asparagine synthase (glutamine-hydrolysing)